MPDINRLLDLATSVLHVVGTLSATVAHLVRGDAAGALENALTAAACILILAAAVAMAELVRLLVRLLVHWIERRFLSAPRSKEGDRDA